MTKVFLMAGSLRKDSVNKKLMHLCVKLLPSALEKQVTTLNDFPLSLYNGDVEMSEGVPENAKKVAEYVGKADRLVFAVPEYNGSTPGVFKNMIDWVSRVKPMPWAGKKVLIVSASPSMMGGMRAFSSTRAPFESCGGFVFPRAFFLADAYNAFNEDGSLKDQKQQELLASILRDYLAF